MENGFYAARVADEGVQSVYVDEDTVYYWQTKALFQQRDDAQQRRKKQTEADKRKAERQAAKSRKEIRALAKSCGGWIGAGALVCLAYWLGPAAVFGSAVACFGAACFRLGSYFRKERAN